MSTEKVSLTLERELLTEARQVAGRRSLSGYVGRALRMQLQRDRLASFLTEMEREKGPIDPDVLAEVRKEWRAPIRPSTRRRGA